MNYRIVAASFILPFALYAGGCGGSSNSLGCPVDPQCYVVSSSGECSADPFAVCSGGSWQCGSEGKLGSGCMPDGGIAPPPQQDAGACVLENLDPPLACNDDSTCVPYDGHCVFDALTGAGSCTCGLPAPDGGTDACVLDCNGDTCLLPSFTITCSGPNDPTCAQYNAECVSTEFGGGAPPEYVCECIAEDPPHGGPAGLSDNP
jgi:hypothetical protein